MAETQAVDPATGECCDCSQQMDCACGGVQCHIGCRSRSSPSGTATFCGFAEYVPSDPPEFYLSQCLSGGVGLTTYGDAGCLGMASGVGMGYSGCNKIDKTTCFETAGGEVTFAPGGTQARDDVKLSDALGFGFPIATVDVYTATTHLLDSSACSCLNDCCCNGSGFSCANCPSADSGSAVLGDQETYQDAIDRAVLNNPPWSASGDCTLHASYTSFVPKGQRFFLFQQGQVLAQVSGQPGHTYSVIIFLGSKPFGTSSPLIPFGQIEATVTCPPSGACSTGEMDVPSMAGQFIAATHCQATDMTTA